MKPIKRAPIIIARVVPVITTRIMTMKKILVALKHKEGGKDKYYRLYQQ
jgi:hypothetical protein